MQALRNPPSEALQTGGNQKNAKKLAKDTRKRQKHLARLDRFEFVTESVEGLEQGLPEAGPLVGHTNEGWPIIGRSALEAKFRRECRTPITLVSGRRRAGKTTLVRQFMGPYTDNDCSSLGLFLDLSDLTYHRFNGIVTGD